MRVLSQIVRAVRRSPTKHLASPDFASLIRATCQATSISAIDDCVAGMRSKRLRQPAGDPAHEVGCAAVESIDPLREVQRFLNLPDLFVLVGWQNARRVAHGHPSDR